MSTKRKVILTSLSLLIVAAVGVVLWRYRVVEPAIPSLFMADLPPNCRQVVLVLSPEEHSVPAQLWLMEKTPEGMWRRAGNEVQVSLGRNGLAWGRGEHTAAPPSGFRVKQEGDGCSPAGVFRLPFAFGYAPAGEASWMHLPYVMETASLFGVDDIKSRFYNQVVDAAVVAKDWDSAETMLRPDELYRWGAFVAHNPQHEPGGGSCIFLHVWRGLGQPTAGCTAMAEDDLKRVLAWLDPAAEPRLVQWVKGGTR